MIGIVSISGAAAAVVTINETPTVVRSRRLTNRYSAEDNVAMVNLYRAGNPATQVAEEYAVSLSTVKRLLRERGVRRQRQD